jgi:hypothetical protein
MRNAIALAALVLIVVICAGSATAAAIDAYNEMSWLDGFTLVVLETNDIPSLHQARAVIQSHGGRVAIMSPPSLILGWIPQDRRAELIGQAGIKSIYDTEVLGGEVDAADFQTRAVINFFNAVKRGDIQRDYFEEAARTAAEPPKPMLHDTVVGPPMDQEGYLKNLEAAGLDLQKLKDQGLLVSHAPGQTMGNSDTMTGTISVTLFMVESNGTIDANLYTWTQDAMQQYVNKVNTGLAWWTSMANNYYDCWAAFMVHYYPGTDVRCQQGYEPVIHNGTGAAPNASTWVGLVMTNFGYSGTHFAKVEAFNTWQRSTYGTNWAYSAFVPYNPNGGAFLDGHTAWTWIVNGYGGPYMVALYKAGGWDPTQVFPHETGHIFNACDEYAESLCDCECTRALGTTSNENCVNCGGSTGCMMKANSFVLCSYTPMQVGWTGTGCAPTPLPAPVATSVSPPSDYQGVTTTITVTGSNFVYGAYVDMGSDVTLNSTTPINSTAFQANITISNTAALGLRNVVVYNRDLQSSTIVNGFEVKRSTKHYASPAGGNVFPYITPANAATALASAIAAAGSGDSVLVRSTTYTNVDLSLSQGVKMYGAWNASFTTRDLATGKTVLSLSGNIEVGPSAPGQTVIDGFELYGGTGTLQVSPYLGRYGGAIWASSSPLTVSNCLIRNSQAHDGSFGGGGGIYASGCTVAITGNEIRTCTAAQGGAMYLDACTGTVANNSIHDNSLLYSAQPANGGGLCVMNSSALAFSGNTINANVADPAMSGSMNGGGVFVKNTSGLSMNGDVVSNNSSGMSGYLGWGGGIHIEASGLTLTSVRIEGNQTKTIGGGLYGDAASSVAMNGGTVLTNSAMIGGGVYVTGPSSQFNHVLWTGNSGTACSISSATSGSFIGNTMNQNSGSSGAGLYVANASITVMNNIITASTGSGIKCGGSPIPSPTYCDVWNNTTNYDGCAPGTGSISLDPRFVNAAGGDYHLAIHSPGIDAGDPSPAYKDPDGSRGDMGIYGSHAFVMDQPEYPKNLTAAPVPAWGHTVLKWSANPEPDVTSYAVYKAMSANFIPSAANFVTLVAAPDTSYDDGPAVSGNYYKVSAVDALGYGSGYAVIASATGIGDDVVSYAFRLHQNHPNPFNPTTRIRYELGSRVHVSLSVFDVGGRLIKDLVDEDAGPGTFTREWDGTNANGEQVSTGVYFYRLNAGSFAETRKMVLIK